jgi:ubiquinone/menaquinone biosynthesis C-methylase UbiE
MSNNTRDRSQKGIASWFEKDGAVLIRRLGIRSGDRVLDFGCGTGGYVLPLVQVVKPNGRVIAVDKDLGQIQALRDRLVSLPQRDLVDLRHTGGELTFSWLTERSLDAVLLFDVLQHVGNWDALFTEIGRILTAKGRIAVNPSVLSHPGRVDPGHVEARLAVHGFHLENRIRAHLMHYDFLCEDEIFCFCRSQNAWVK